MCGVWCVVESVGGSEVPVQSGSTLHVMHV